MNEALPAGDFSEWLRAMRSALAGGPGMQVACGECVGCCTSSYFIKVRPHEAAARQLIPSQHLIPSPGEPGTLMMGYDDKGHCPMFGAGGCSIYANRPETCRTYDCRIFSAAGMKAGDGRPVINERIARWRFEYSGTGLREHQAVMATASFLRQHVVRFPGGHIPSRPAEIAVLAVKAYPVFMTEPASDEDAAAAIIAACKLFDQPVA